MLILDLKKLMKYEQKQKTTNENTPQVVHAPENVINVTIIKETNSKQCQQQPTVCTAKSVKNTEVQVQTETETEADKPSSDSEAKPAKQRKQLLRLPRHIRTKNPKIIYKTGNVNGVLVRNTPTDLFQKYQEDWAKFKDFIPGENQRLNIRKSVRKRMQHKDDYDSKVRKRIVWFIE